MIYFIDLRGQTMNDAPGERGAALARVDLYAPHVLDAPPLVAA